MRITGKLSTCAQPTLHPAPLNGDPALLERLVANLVDNAIVHSVAQDAWITVETGTDNGGSWLRLCNSGPEVPESMVSEIFEPFRWMDGERTATATDVGLGLSIVRAVADLHGATVDAPRQRWWPARRSALLRPAGDR